MNRKALLPIVAAFATIYLVWGTTYMGLAIILRTLPPFASGAIRFLLAGVILAGFTQLYAFFAPLLTKMAAVYGTFVAFFAILAWLSISFNLLLFGACWTRVRDRGLPEPEPAPADEVEAAPAETPRPE